MIASDEPWVRAPVVSPGRVEQVGEHPDAALLDLGRARVLGVVDEVAVQVLGDDPLRLRLHPRGHEGGEVARRVALEREVLGDQAHGVDAPSSPCRGTPGSAPPGWRSGCRRGRRRRRIGRDGHGFSLQSANGTGDYGEREEVRSRGAARAHGRASPGREHQRGADEEAHGAEQGAGDGDPDVEHLVGARQDVAGQRRGHEEHGAEHVEPGDPPRQRTVAGS